MKAHKYTLLLFTLLLTGSALAQDTLRVMKGGNVVFKRPVSAIDSVSFYNAFNPFLTEKLSQDSRFSLFYQALEATGYATLFRNTPIEDPDFVPYNFTGQTFSANPTIYPSSKLWGYTLLVESNDVMAANNIHTLEELDAYAAAHYSALYPDGSGVTDRKDKRNYLNRFVAYHCIDRLLRSSYFLDAYDNLNQVKKYDLDNYFATLLDNTLIRFTTNRATQESNLINWCDASNTTTAVRFAEPIDNLAKNGYYHAIDKMLVYTPELNADLSNRRLRFDVSSFFREIFNDFFPTWLSSYNRSYSTLYYYPLSYSAENLRTYNTNSDMLYYLPNFRYNWAYRGDFFSFRRKSDCEFNTLPIPAGTYEIRFGYIVFQTAELSVDSLECMIDGVSAGVLENSVYGANPLIEWEFPGSNTNDPQGLKNDSLMRKRGYMKAPDCISLASNSSQTARMDSLSLRKIMGTFTFETSGQHTIRLKHKGSSYDPLLMDYFEFMPVNLIEKEGID